MEVLEGEIRELREARKAEVEVNQRALQSLREDFTRACRDVKEHGEAQLCKLGQAIMECMQRRDPLIQRQPCPAPLPTSTPIHVRQMNTPPKPPVMGDSSAAEGEAPLVDGSAKHTAGPCLNLYVAEPVLHTPDETISQL